MEPFWIQHFMLPGQHHRSSCAVADALQDARQCVADLVGCDAFEIVFTGGGTDANNLGVLGVANRCEPGQIIVSAIEHESVWHAAKSLESRGWTVDVAKPNSEGLVTTEEISRLLCDKTRLVCLQAANPYLGTCQPVREVADLCHSRGVPVHCDAVQVFGKLPVDIRQYRADTMAISAHKIYGPKGAGGLYVRRGFSLSAIGFGETREMGLRPGSENVCGWIGLGAAAMLAGRCAEDAGKKMTELKAAFLRRLSQHLPTTPSQLCQQSPSLPNTLLIELPSEAGRIVRTARQLVVATPRGSAEADEMTRCLHAIGISNERAKRCCRVSFGWTTSQEQVERAADLLAEACDVNGD